MSRDNSAKPAQSGSASPAVASAKVEENPILGSPLKRHRPSVSGPPERATATPSLALDSVLSATPPTKTTFTAGGSNTNDMEEEEL